MLRNVAGDILVGILLQRKWSLREVLGGFEELTLGEGK